MKPAGSMMKPAPSDVTCLGRSALGPRKFLNRSSRGEPGGTLGMDEGGGAIAGPPAKARAAQNASANRMSIVLKMAGLESSFQHSAAAPAPPNGLLTPTAALC